MRTFKPIQSPRTDLSLIVEAAVKAPNSGNRQVGCLFLVTDTRPTPSQESAHEWRHRVSDDEDTMSMTVEAPRAPETV